MHIVILGAGLGGVPMAFEMKDLMKDGEKITVISNTEYFHFVPSNPWVAVNWRERDDIQVFLPDIFKKRGIDFNASGAKKVDPKKNKVELNDGTVIDYDYLIIATGPELAFDDIEGLGPHGGFTQSICHVDHAVIASTAWENFCKNPGPIVVGAVQGASCFGPAYEFAMIMDTDLKRRKIRDKVPMTFVTSEPYVGHLGLDGVGDTKGLLESAFRDRHIKWITNSKIKKVEDGTIFVSEVDEKGEEKATHDLAFKFSMMLPAFRGIAAVRDIAGLVNPKGFIIIDEYQRNPAFNNIYAVGVCIAIAPTGPTPVPVGVPKTGYMIETMVTTTAHNIRDAIDGNEVKAKATWNAFCLADFGDEGVAFVAAPQIPPRNVNWTSQGKWVHLAKVAFEKYFLRKVRKGIGEPFYERQIMKILGMVRLKDKG